MEFALKIAAQATTATKGDIGTAVLLRTVHAEVLKLLTQETLYTESAGNSTVLNSPG